MIGRPDEPYLVALAEAQVRSGDVDAGIATAQALVDDSRRTEALLRIGAWLARTGREKLAIAVLKRNHPPQVEREFMDVDGMVRRVFDHDSPPTWTESYEPYLWGTNSTFSAENERSGDLAAAAVAFHMARGGPLRDTFPEVFSQEATGPRGRTILRKMTGAQAEGGDVRGALRWAESIRAAQIPALWDTEDADLRQFMQELILENYIEATLGVAEGLLRRAEQLR